MQIRTATPADAAAISAIASQTFAQACPPDTPADELQRYIDANLTVAAIADVVAARGRDVRVLEDGATVVGFSLVDHEPERLDLPAADGMPELTRCYVRADYHGTGAAQALLPATLAALSTPVRLMVNDRNARAIRFYQRNGFAQVGETRFQCGADVHRDLVMVRPAA